MLIYLLSSDPFEISRGRVKADAYLSNGPAHISYDSSFVSSRSANCTHPEQSVRNQPASPAAWKNLKTAFTEALEELPNKPLSPTWGAAPFPFFLLLFDAMLRPTDVPKLCLRGGDTENALAG